MNVGLGSYIILWVVQKVMRVKSFTFCYPVIQMILPNQLLILIRDMVVERCSRKFGCETIHPTQKFTSINLFQMSCLITWAWSFLNSEVVEAVRCQMSYLGAHFGTLTQQSVYPIVPVLLTKDSPRNEISYDFHLPYLEF